MVISRSKDWNAFIPIKELLVYYGNENTECPQSVIKCVTLFLYDLRYLKKIKSESLCIQKLINLVEQQSIEQFNTVKMKVGCTIHING